MRKVAILSLLGVGALIALFWPRSPVVEVRPQVALQSAQDAAPAPPARAPGPQVLAAAPSAVALSRPVSAEATFMADLRVLAEMDAEAAVERAVEGGSRFGNSADAPERRSILIHALARTGRAAEARGEAERMVNECPDSAWVEEIERFTGAHRHRNVRLAANGQLEYE